MMLSRFYRGEYGCLFNKFLINKFNIPEELLSKPSFMGKPEDRNEAGSGRIGQLPQPYQKLMSFLYLSKEKGNENKGVYGEDLGV
jgi:hypothetical protein